MSDVFRRLGPLYRGTFLFGLACGISIALTPLYLDAAGYQKEEIGTLALFFAAGLVLFAVPVGALVRRWGGKRTLTVMLFGYAASVFAFPFAETYPQIAAVRFLDGMFSIGVWVSSETILLSRADEEHKGHLTSLYAVWLASGYVTGPVLATGLTHFLSLQPTFLIASCFAAFAGSYVLLRLPRAASRGEELQQVPVAAGVPAEDEATAARPEPIRRVPEKTPIFALLARIKTSCFAAFCYGYFQASVVLFLPLYLIESKGIARAETIIIPGLFCLGMLLFATKVGRLGDQVGHLRVVTLFSFFGTLCVFGFVFVDQYLLMCTLVFLAGATFATMSPVALALVGVMVPQASLGRANSLYNAFYASGILLGPPVSSVIFAEHGGAAMLYHLAALWSVFVVFGFLYLSDDPATQRRLRKAVL